MNEIVKNLLLAGDELMPEMHLKQLIVLVVHLPKRRKSSKVYENSE